MRISLNDCEHGLIQATCTQCHPKGNILCPRLVIRLADDTGTIYRWTIRRIPRACNVVLGKKNRIISGWEFEDHEGYARFSEGNWRDLVALFHQTAENYGFRLLSELS